VGLDDIAKQYGLRDLNPLIVVLILRKTQKWKDRKLAINSFAIPHPSPRKQEK
jgi:hypothetical protein